MLNARTPSMQEGNLEQRRLLIVFKMCEWHTLSAPFVVAPALRCRPGRCLELLKVRIRHHVARN